MSFDFGHVLNRAWQIIWKHKVLWIFGIFAGCGRGGGSGGGGGGGNAGGGGGNGYDPDNLPSFINQQALADIAQWFQDNWWIWVVLALVVLVLVLLSIFLGTIGRIALIKGTADVEAGAERLSFGALFQGGLPYFWRVFVLSLLIGLAFLAIFVPLALFGVLTAGIGFICILPIVCLLIPVAWAVTIVLEQANAAIVIENLGISAGLRRGWELCRSNLGAVLVMGLILGLGAGIVGFIIALPILIALLPVFFAVVADKPATPLLAAALCFVAYLPVLVVLSGIVNAYVQSAWALTFLRLAAPKETAPVPTAPNA